MLKSLFIKNVAIISQLNIDLCNKLNVLSGETGAGKSIILDSLSFVLGGKADKSLIRHGTDEMAVEAVFDVSKRESCKEILREMDINFDDEIIIYRSQNADGGQCKINGKNVVASMLKTVTSQLVDIYGQSEHISLLKTSNHIKMLDDFGQEEIKPVREKLSGEFFKYKAVIKELSSFGADLTERERLIDLYSYQIKEIEQANLKDGEEEKLSAKRLQLLNVGKISSGISAALNMLNEGEYSVNSQLKTLIGTVAGVSKYLPEIEENIVKLNEVKYQVEDIINSLETHNSSLEYDEKTADEIENRYDLIKNFKKKYGSDIKEINKYLEKIKSEYERLTNADGKISALNAQKKQTLESLKTLCSNLTCLRQKYSLIFQNKIESELKSLNMGGSSFKVEFKDSDADFESAVTQNGVDNVEFLLSANKGEPLKPLAKIISGGEMSRFMLAIKSISAVIDDIGTMIFDEIDAGISGQTASVVAQKIAKIAYFRQVVLITHTPIIAAMADKNFLIVKESQGEKTNSSIIPLEHKDVVKEISRLIGVGKSAQYASLHAEEMLKWSSEYKESLENNVEKILESNFKKELEN